MPKLIEEFPVKPPKYEKYDSILDGRCWQITCEEYDYDKEDIKSLMSRIKQAAKLKGRYVRVFITASNDLIVQLREKEYIPRIAPRRKKNANQA